LFEKLIKLKTELYPRHKIIVDNKNCFLSFASQKKTNKKFIKISIGENKLNIDKYGNTAGLIRGSESEIKKRTAKTEFIINKNFSIIERFFISYLPV
tara:strand:+ start:547 stop:837 length:291 start_codon:yes stop_codon:yes gene_type:complete